MILVFLSSHLNHISIHDAELLVVPGHEVVNDTHVHGWLTGAETADAHLVTATYVTRIKHSEHKLKKRSPQIWS